MQDKIEQKIIGEYRIEFIICIDYIVIIGIIKELLYLRRYINESDHKR